MIQTLAHSPLETLEQLAARNLAADQVIKEINKLHRDNNRSWQPSQEALP